jgi:hypothetical protein
MTAIEVFRTVTTDGAQLVRPRKDAPLQYDIKPLFTGSNRGWTIVDAFTASAVVQVWNALSEANRAKFGAMPLTRMVTVTWKLVGK